MKKSYNISTCQGINGRFVCPEQPLFCNARIPWQGLGKLQDSGFLFGVDMVKEIPLTQGKVALVSDADYDYLSGFRWYARKNGGLWYAERHGKDGKAERMHRVVASPEKGKHVDHINGNGLDNRRENLRVCSNSENMMNRGPQANNKSGYKGVSWYARERKWFAVINVCGRKFNLGGFKDKILAARAYDEAAKKYHGEFAKTNF